MSKSVFKQDIEQERENAHIVEKVINNLRNTGSLEGFSLEGRPFNARTKTGYPFSAGNFLRYAAYSAENRHEDLRWFSEKEIGNLKNISIKDNAVPLVIEQYGNDKCNLIDFYNFDDLDGDKLDISTYKSVDTDYSQIVKDKLAAVHIETDSFSSSDIYEAVFDYAKNQRCNDLSAKLTAYMFLRDHRIKPEFDKENPLLSEVEIKALEKNHKRLFNSMSTSKNINDYINKAYYLFQRNAAEKNAENEPELFKGLSVVYHWSEAYLNTPDGKSYDDILAEQNGFSNVKLEGETDEEFNSRKRNFLYPFESKGLTLTGRDAYDFLAVINNLDQEVEQLQVLGAGGYRKTRLSVYFGDNSAEECRVDLGDLEFENKKSISEILPLLFGGKVKEQAEYEQFVKDEQDYLKANPRIKEMNEYSAEMFTYIVDRKLAEILEDKSLKRIRDYNMYVTVYDEKPLDGYEFKNLRSCNFTKPYHQWHPNWIEDPGLPSEEIVNNSDMVAIVTRTPPKDMWYYMRENRLEDKRKTMELRRFNAYIYVPDEDLENLEKICDFSLDDKLSEISKEGIESVNELMYWYIADRDYSYKMYANNENGNVDWNREPVSVYIPSSAHDLTLKYGDNQLYSGEFAVGDHRLASNNIADLLKGSDETVNKEIIDVMKTYQKYNTSLYDSSSSEKLSDYFRELYNVSWPKDLKPVPSKEESLANFREIKRPDLKSGKLSHDEVFENANYYIKLSNIACYDGKEYHDRENFVLKEMAKDGLTESQIKYVFDKMAQHNQFDKSAYVKLTHTKEFKENIRIGKETRKERLSAAKSR